MSNWTKQEILFALRRRGTTAAELARANGVTRWTIYSGMQRPYPKVQTAIAAAIGEPRHRIWPEFYGADDQPNTLISRRSAA